jgi:hypothetical protein
VWGDGIYTDDSLVCEAGVHAGVIDRKGGWVFFELLPGQQSYASATRNGVASSSYAFHPGSYRFVTVSAAARKAMGPAPSINSGGNVLPSQWALADLSGDRTCLTETIESSSYREFEYWTGFEYRTASEKENDLRRVSNRCNRAITFEHHGTRHSVAARGFLRLKCAYATGENPFGMRVTNVMFCAAQ